MNVCWVVTIVYSIDFVRYNFQNKASVFYRYFSIVIAAVTATGLSENLFTLFFFYLLTVPLIYPLIKIRESEESRAAAKSYLRYMFLPAIFIAMPALLYINKWLVPFQEISIKDVTQSDTLASFLLACLIVGFSKNCVAPFFSWLPKTSVAPAPVSGLVHSVGAVHTGTFAILKIIVYLYGYEYMSVLSGDFWKAGWIIYLCGYTALYSAIKAYLTSDLKKRFSYSTVGQLSYVITAGLIGSQLAVLGAVLHIVSHSIAKMTLFYVAGTFNSVYGTVDAREIAKLIPHMRWIAVVVGVCGLSIAGFPLLAGFYSKDIMLLEEFDRHYYAAAGFLVVGSLLNFFYIFPILKAAFVGKKQEDFLVKAIPFGMLAALIISSVLIICLSICMPNLAEVLDSMDP